MVRPKLPREAASWLIGGTALHSVIEAWETDDGTYESPRSFDLKERFSKFFWDEVAEEKKRVPDLRLWLKPPAIRTVDQDLQNRHDKLKGMLETYEKDALSGEWDFLVYEGKPMVETPFEMEFGGVLVKGYIDSAKWYHKDFSMIVEDMKTGNRETTPSQLGFYRVVLNEHFNIPVDDGEFFYLKDGKKVRHSLRLYTKDYYDQVFSTMNKIVEQKLFIPNPGSQCDNCQVIKFCREKGTQSHLVNRITNERTEVESV